MKRQDYQALDPESRLILDRAIAYIFHDAHILSEKEVLERINTILARNPGRSMYIAIINELTK